MANRVLGVDPGSRVTGYGIVEEKNHTLSVVTFGALKIDTKGPFSDRLKQIYEGLSEVMERYQPNEAVFETLFFAKNVSSAIKLGQARGAAITAAVNYGVKISEYSPTQIKQAIAGYGRSSKDQIKHMVCLLLGMNLSKTKQVPLDATDALATAICHINSGKLLSKYQGRV